MHCSCVSTSSANVRLLKTKEISIYLNVIVPQLSFAFYTSLFAEVLIYTALISNFILSVNIQCQIYSSTHGKHICLIIVTYILLKLCCIKSLTTLNQSYNKTQCAHLKATSTVQMQYISGCLEIE